MIEPNSIPSEAPQITCTGCAAPIPEESEFCPHCGAPLVSTIWYDPYKRIFAEGYVNRRLSFGQPRPWALVAQIVIVLIVFSSFVGYFLSLVLSPVSGQASVLAGVFLALLLTGGFALRMIINLKRLRRQTDEAQRTAGDDAAALLGAGPSDGPRDGDGADSGAHQGGL